VREAPRLELHESELGIQQEILDVQRQLRLDARGDDGQALGLPGGRAWLIMRATSQGVV
jgi:hypothetical protein